MDAVDGEEGIELDSYMYQTVASNAVIGVAAALAKPLYRRKIKGKPKVTSLHYEGELGDEVEDL